MDLQSTDSGLDELEKLKKNFQQEMDAFDSNLANLKEKLQAEKKTLEDIVKQRKMLEIEAGSLETKITKYLGQQNEVKSNEQFAALKLEIEKSKDEKGKAEEKALEFLFKEDEQKAKIQLYTQKLAEGEKQAAEDKKALQNKIEDCDKAAVDKKKERTERLAVLPPEYAESYESLRNHGKKIAVALVKEDNTCSGCNMNVAPQVLNEIRKNIGIQRCNCGRYLCHRD